MRPAALQSLRLTKPAEPLVPLADLKKHLEVEHGEDDAYIGSLAEAAEAHLTGTDTPWQRVWVNSRWRDYWPDFTRRPLLRLAPVIGLHRITYLDPDGTEMLIKPAAYDLIREASGVRVHFLDSYELPSEVATRPDAVRVDYEAGYGPEASDVPASVRHAVKLLAGHWYRNREEVVVSQARAQSLPMGVEALMAPLRRYGVEAWDNMPCGASLGSGVTAVAGPLVIVD
ncbi:MAG: phage head-tail connector protein [Acidobacteria bacterium]|nr:phage head-tail connector protein [Acidobacteriota bacterium]